MALETVPLHLGFSRTSKGFDMNNIVIFKQQYGEFTTEKNGRLTGSTLTIKGKRKDGKYSVIHATGSGKRVTKIYTVEQLQWVIFQMEKTEKYLKESAYKAENNYRYSFKF
jgi:hypothetical protein